MRISDWSSDVCSSDLHRIARIWNTPVLGEIFMALSKAEKLAEGLAAQGMPADIAREEAEQWKNKDKRRAILKLYRSAKGLRSEEHTSELQSLMRISYAVFCLKKTQHHTHTRN